MLTYKWGRVRDYEESGNGKTVRSKGWQVPDEEIILDVIGSLHA